MKIDHHTKQFSEIIRVLAKDIVLFDKVNASCCGFTIAQSYAIYEIGLAKELSLNELANLLNLDNSTISRTIDNLVKQELVLRDEDKTDRRYLKIRLTEKGTAEYRAIESQISSYYHRVLNSIPTEKRTQVIESLDILSKALKENKCCR